MTTSTTPVLNTGQQAAADGFFQFLFDDKPELIISGPGGVGKTYLMGYLINETLPRYHKTCELMSIKPEFTEVVMSATTNKAADVLGQATGNHTETIHSFLNLKVKDDFATGRSTLTKGGGWMVHRKKIIFVDESSMIDTALRNKILEGTHESKIVYVGDHCQLAPIMEPISPIYRDNLPFYELKQPVRNAGQPALMRVCQQLRETVETGEFWPIQAIPGVIDWLTNEEVEQEIQNHFAQQTTSSRILAYTNPRVVQFNDYIRGLRNLPPEFIAGEFLINNSAIRIGKTMISVEEELKILRQDSMTRVVEIDKDVFLEVRDTTLESTNGTVYHEVPVPVDMAHYNSLIKYYQQRKNWNRYFHLKNEYPDLRQRDAATVHKSQGSTYDTVFIDMDNLSSCHQPTVAARLLYVAFTRARNRIVLFGDLTLKYGGLVR